MAMPANEAGDHCPCDVARQRGPRLPRGNVIGPNVGSPSAPASIIRELRTSADQIFDLISGLEETEV